MIIALALIESLVIYALLSFFLLNGKAPGGLFTRAAPVVPG